MAHRVMGNWEPSAAAWLELMGGAEASADFTRPYPFYLASPLEAGIDSLGEPTDWVAEWKWDGIRAQLIRRRGEVLLWSRGEELVTDRYPEIAGLGKLLPEGTVLDGEILCWRDGKPLPFQILQQRIGRKSVSRKLLTDAPVVYMAYDLIEEEGRDLRGEAQEFRRSRLEALGESLMPASLLLSPLVVAQSWDDLKRQREESRERMVEGLMLKRRTARYQVGRVRGDWWKWKVDPLSLDLVMIYAQAGHGRRASLFTDYTFAAWDGDRLVGVAKAYSGLTDAEIREVDKWIKAHTVERHGPVRVVEPRLVFEIGFEGVQESSRHKSGVAVRFPRILRWRRDKPAEEADGLEALRALARGGEAPPPRS
jgi:DNA ligase-1